MLGVCLYKTRTTHVDMITNAASCCYDDAAGAIYDINKSYTDVFMVVGGVYVVATIVFGAIPALQFLRQRSAPVDELNGATKFETFRISTKRSTSRGSIANGVDAAGAAAAQPLPASATADSSAALVSAYGAITPPNAAGGGVGDAGGHGYGYGYGGGVPEWSGSRSGSAGQTSSSPAPMYEYGSLQ